VILLDANLLIYAHDTSSPFQEGARRWLERIFSGSQAVRVSWVTLLAFLRITTNPRLFGEPLSTAEAIGYMRDWLATPCVELLSPGKLHLSILDRLLSESGARGPLVMDVHLAALAIEHQATLCTTDGDFRRFRGLRLYFPLASGTG
jgi:toxin-antitoxin system PIN domain toxin